MLLQRSSRGSVDKTMNFSQENVDSVAAEDCESFVVEGMTSDKNCCKSAECSTLQAERSKTLCIVQPGTAEPLHTLQGGTYEPLHTLQPGISEPLYTFGNSFYSKLIQIKFDVMRA